MGTLKVLPSGIANMIAAGEVVQRPSSVVKELVENAVDAGADKIDVIIKDSGRTLIQVIDNGCGMSASDAVLCFERHATSKIEKASDLEEILTYGFRGEALASIAAVSEITLRTRRLKDESGVQATLCEGGKVQCSTVSCPIGSNFVIRNLFYNTPARRKFLKSDSVEIKHIVDEFTRVALTRPEVEFRLTHNGKDLFVLKKAKSLKFRILDLLGSSVATDIVDISAETSIVRVSGFVGKPRGARKTPGNQFFFINGRYFRSAYLNKAVMKAYEGLTPEGFTPPYFIFLEADPHSIDVNIHPTKTEIKFEDESVVFQIIYACIHETLGRNAFGEGIDFDTEGAVELPELGKSFEEYRGPVDSYSAGFDPTYDPFAQMDGHSGGNSPSDASQAADSGSTHPVGNPMSRNWGGPIRKDGNYGALFEERTLPAGKYLIIQGRYVITPVSSGIMIVNVRRAFERIHFEKCLAALGGGQKVSRTSLFPVEMETGVASRILLDENAGLLSSLGFSISPVGTEGICVSAVPDIFGFREDKVTDLIFDVIDILSEQRNDLSEIMQQRLAQRFALLGSSNAVLPSSPVEAGSLVDSLFACKNPELTPGGKRTVCILPMDEIDKKFQL